MGFDILKFLLVDWQSLVKLSCNAWILSLLRKYFCQPTVQVYYSLVFRWRTASKSILSLLFPLLCINYIAAGLYFNRKARSYQCSVHMTRILVDNRQVMYLVDYEIVISMKTTSFMYNIQEIIQPSNK